MLKNWNETEEYSGDQMKVHHTGIIVKDLEKNIILYTKLGYNEVSNIVVDNVQQNRVVFLQNQNNKIELLEPLNEKSSISKKVIITSVMRLKTKMLSLKISNNSKSEKYL